MPWPTAADLVAYASLNGVSLSLSDAESWLAQAVAEFEAMTGHSPFYATGVASPRDVPTRRSVILALGCGAQSVESVADMVATSYRAVWRGIPGQPRSWIRALEQRHEWGPWSDCGPASVTVTADWGAVPVGMAAPDVNMAVLARALNWAEAASGGEIAEVKQGPVTLKYATGGSPSAVRDAQFRGVVSRWSRLEV